MRNFNARVPGLVGLLETTTDGRAPDVLNGTLQATFDLQEFISIGKREYAELQADVPASSGDYRWDTGPTGSLVPGPTEAWIVTDYSVKATLPTGRLTTMVPTIWRRVRVAGSLEADLLPMSVAVPNSSLQTNVGGTGLAYLWAHADPVPLLMLPGSELGYSLLDWGGSGAGTLIRGYVGFYRLRL